jgi:hypothetical protein
MKEYTAISTVAAEVIKFIFKEKFFITYLMSLIHKNPTPFYYPSIEASIQFIHVFFLSFIKVINNYLLSF